MEPSDQKLLDRFDATSKRIKDSKGGADAELAYAIAYQDLVKAGLRQQIRKKYRAI